MENKKLIHGVSVFLFDSISDKAFTQVDFDGN